MMDFSVIIPAKNESLNIERCLSSIKKNCEYPENKYEIIVVDNGSTDDTVHISKSAGAKVFIKPDITIASLRNFGASVASGSILVFLDADCSVLDGWLMEASRYLNKSEIVCFGSAPVIPEDSTWVQTTWFQVRNKGELVTETQWLESMNMFIRREAFKKVNGFDETLITCEDVDISYRLSLSGKIISDPSIRAIHHGEAATVKIFFKKEKWRGKSNYSGLLRHGLKVAEIPSLILPLYYGFFSLMFFFSFIFSGMGFFITVFLFWQAPVLLITGIKQYRKTEGFRCFIQLYYLYNIYYTARFASMFG